jgi:hypothetical protein
VHSVRAWPMHSPVSHVALEKIGLDEAAGSSAGDGCSGKKCDSMYKAEKVEVESRDACVVGVFIFYSLMRPTSGSLHWGETINIDASDYFLS